MKGNVWASIIIILGLIMIGIFNADFSTPYTQDSACYYSYEKSQPQQTSQQDANMPSTRTRGARESLIESNAHGGSWFDSFDDEAGINWAMSDNLFLNKSNVKIKKLILSKQFQKDSNTVALWHFDEGSGVIVHDETDNYNNGTLGGDGLGNDLPGWTQGRFNTALGFDGVNDYVDVPDDPSLRLTDAFTLHVWVYPISNGGNRWQTILEKGSDSYGLYLTNSLTFEVYNGGLSPVSIQTPPVNLGEWYHLVSTYNKYEGSRKLYLNGELVTSSTHTTNISGSVGNSLGINRHPNNGDAFFNGIIDEVAICNRSLSAIEINDLYGGDRYHITGNITSNIISLPDNMHWDTIIINRTQPGNSYLNVTILNAANNQPIPGSPKYNNEGEFDISYIDPQTYPSIKLNATFKGNGSTTPILYSWGVSWCGKNCWKDSFFGGDKLEKEDILTADGNVIISGSRYGVGTIDPTPQAIWHFDEGSGTVAEDATNNNFDGNIQGGASWTTGKFGKGLSFDGVNDHVTAPPVFTGNKDVTISAWVKFESISYSSSPGVVFIGKSSSNQAIQMIKMNGSGQLGVGRWNGPFALTTKNYNDGSWHHVVGRFYDGDKYDIFVDGEFEASNSGSYNVPSDGATMIGGRPNSEYWEGSIDEVVVYKRALTDLEIRNWYYSTIAITSKSINLPDGSHWDKLIINKTEPAYGWINITILDGNTNQPIDGYFNLIESIIDISSLNPILHKSIKLKAQAGESCSGLLILHDWSVNWTTNTPPKINGIIEESSKVNRTNSTQIHINVSDSCDPPQRLTVDIEYKSPKDTTWQSAYLSNFHFNNGSWAITFTPTKKADIGYYSFKINCMDSFESETIKIFDNVIKVLNNPPTKPNVTILPKTPITTDDLIVYVTNATDIESEPITYYYIWYRNNELQPELTTELVQANYTFKNESWKCVVTPNDGHDNGPSAEAETFIINLPPEILTSGNFSAEVGTPFEFKLEAFDIDNDLSDLSWTLLSVFDFITMDPETGVLTGIPTRDGLFYIYVSVNDSDGGIDRLTLRLNVIRVNRPPIITTQDNRSAKTGKFYYIDYNATDDFTNSELLKWALKTNASWLKINITTGELSGTPSKADVGWCWVNISVVDDEGGRTYRYLIINVSKTPNKVPKLSNCKMLPREGDTNTEFIFSVYYLDENSEPPTMIQVNIDGVSQNLELRPGETPYKGRYEFSTKLTEGEHTYYFVASDGMDTITSDTYQTPNIKDARANEQKEVIWTWENSLIIIIVIIIIILLFSLFLWKKKRKSKEETILSKEPQIKKPMVQPEVLKKRAPIPPTTAQIPPQQYIASPPQVPPSTATTEQRPLTPSSQQTPELPPVTVEDQDQPDMTEESETTQEDKQDISVHLPTDALDTNLKSESTAQESESIFEDAELLPDDTEYIVSESPELIESSKPLFTEPMPTTPEPEIKDQVSESKVQESSEKTTEDFEQSTATQQPTKQQPQTKTTQSKSQQKKTKET